ncbi:MAG TPA: SEC-C metal-binding domain-containing protein, partial [Clostridiaceae bacterium]
VSLEDDLMRIFGSDKLQGVVEKLGLQEDEAIESKMISNAIENAQKKVEGNNFDIRKTLLNYDDVINKQREIIYKQRTEVLEGEDIHLQVQGMIKDLIYSAVDSHASGLEDELEKEMEKLIDYLEDIYLPKNATTAKELSLISNDEIKERLLFIAQEIYKEKESEFSPEHMREIERVILLRVVDTKWMDHIDDMDHLKQGIGLRAYKQQDPAQAYSFEGSAMFEEMIYNIKIDTVKYLFHVQIQKAPERERIAQETATNYDEDDTIKKEPLVKEHKVGRNDPCPCGSGKKYKNCCGRLQ